MTILKSLALFMQTCISPFRCVQHECIGGLTVLHRESAGCFEPDGQSWRLALHDAALAGKWVYELEMSCGTLITD